MVVLAGGTDSDSTSTSRGTGTPPNCGGSNYKYMRQEVQKVRQADELWQYLLQGLWWHRHSKALLNRPTLQSSGVPVAPADLKR